MTSRRKPKVEIMAIGSELLTPWHQDTNSLYLIQRLDDLGLDVSCKTVVGDDRENLLARIKSALIQDDILITTGGLGPTQDDNTKEVLAEAMGRRLVFREDILRKIRERFRRRGLAMPASNKKQAFIIAGADILENKNGTAPGLWIETPHYRVILLPGPPHELKPMFEEMVMPRLQAQGKGRTFRRILKIAGLTESQMESLISGLYPSSPELRMTTRATPGQVEIHLAAFSREAGNSAWMKLEKLEKRLLKKLGKNVFSTSGEELEEVVGRLLREKKKTLAAAESCTGGLLGHRLTNVPGSSDYFLQGWIVYSNAAKTRELGIPDRMLQKYGAVSRPVARAMALRAREKAQAGFGLSITGMAGPTGGTPEKPVGLVFIALADEGTVEVRKNLFFGRREQIKFQSSQKALDMIRRRLLEEDMPTSGGDFRT